MEVEGSAVLGFRMRRMEQKVLHSMDELLRSKTINVKCISVIVRIP